MSLKNEFIAHEKRQYKFKIGRYIASSLSGLIVGFVSASIALIPILFIVCRGLGKKF